MDTDRPAANLVAVADDVVGVGQRGAGIGVETRQGLRLRRGEGMVYGGPGPATHGDITFGDRFGDRLEQGRVHHPQEAPGVLVHQPAAPGDFVAGRSEQVLGRSTGTRGEEDAVPWLGAGGGGQAVAFSVADVLAHRPTQGAVLGDRDIGQALGTTLLGPVLPGVEGAPRLGRAAGHHDGPHVGRLEDSERGVGEVVGQLGEL